MRLLALAGVLGLAVIAIAPSVTPADAGPRYCLQFRGGAENCGFYSFNQCRAALSSEAGMCIVAPWQTTATSVYTSRGAYRVVRDAID